MKGSQISTILSGDRIVQNSFRGCFAINAVPTLEDKLDLNKPNVVIMNSLDSHGKGRLGHWFLIFIDMESDHSAYADPLNKPAAAYSEDLKTFLDLNIPERDEIPFRVQGGASDLCGYYVIYFAHALCSGRTLRQACKIFKPNRYSENDAVVMKWFKKTYKYMPVK